MSVLIDIANAELSVYTPNTLIKKKNGMFDSKNDHFLYTLKGNVIKIFEMNKKTGALSLPPVVKTYRTRKEAVCKLARMIADSLRKHTGVTHPKGQNVENWYIPKWEKELIRDMVEEWESHCKRGKEEMRDCR